MATTVNQVIVVGNLGKDPELRYTPAGQGVTTFSAATSRSWRRDESSEWQEETEWHRIVVWGNAAEQCAERLRKGSKVYVQGRLQTRSWEDKQTGAKRYVTEIIAEKVVFLDKREGGQGGAAARAQDDYIDAAAASGARPTQASPAREPDLDAAERANDGTLDEFDDLPF